MTSAANPVGRPRKAVTNEVAADRLLGELRELGDQQRRINDNKIRLALEAREVGVTNIRIAQALGLTEAAISKWVKAARKG